MTQGWRDGRLAAILGPLEAGVRRQQELYKNCLRCLFSGSHRNWLGDGEALEEGGDHHTPQAEIGKLGANRHFGGKAGL